MLYVEDNVSNVRLLERLLVHRPNIRLLTTLEGSVGVELARQHRPDLILLDVHMPDLSGFEVLELLRADEQTASIPVVMLSADASHEQIQRFRDAGARDYLTKPLDLRIFCLNSTSTCARTLAIVYSSPVQCERLAVTWIPFKGMK